MNSLDVAIENLYKSFSDVSAPTTIDGCSHCIDDKDIDRLLNAELRNISPDDLSSYASSAFLTVGDIPDYLYFLPRILEISVRDSSWWPDIEVTGRALSNTDVSNWPSERRQALTELFISVIRRFIDNGEFNDLDDWMCGIGRSGVDVRPFLDMLEESREAVSHYVTVNAVSIDKGKLSNEFWEAGDRGQDTIIEWMRSEKVKRIYSEWLNG